MHTKRGFDRLVNFSDAVVAIAITVLVLPLVDIAAGIGSRSVDSFVAANGYKIFVFVLSFAVIGRLWMVHHEVYENAAGYTTPLLMANLVWLISIVFLPFPTELLAAGQAERLAYGLYVGPILVASAAIVVQQWIIMHDLDLQAEGARGSLSLIPSLVPTILLSVALVVAVAAPNIGLWSMLLLFLTGPVERLIKHKRPGWMTS